MGGAHVAVTFVVTILIAAGLFVVLPLLAEKGATNAAVFRGGQLLVQHLLEAPSTSPSSSATC